MNLTEFKETTSSEPPPSTLSAVLRALWLEARGDWDGAHRVVQNLNDASAAWVHAYLHRKEGDSSNAGYWYSRAGRKMSTATFPEEWDQIAETLLAEE